MIVLFKCLQTGVDPTQLQAARKLQKKRFKKEKAEREKLNQKSPQKMNAVVKLVSPLPDKSALWYLCATIF